MKIVSFDSFCVIRKTSPRDISGEKLKIEIDEPDGTAVSITRVSDGKYAITHVNSGECYFDQTFIKKPDAYVLRYKNSAGTELSCKFKAELRGLSPLYMSYESEVQKMWDAICSLKEIVKTEEEKIDTVIDGYITE